MGERVLQIGVDDRGARRRDRGEGRVERTCVASPSATDGERACAQSRREEGWRARRRAGHAARSLPFDDRRLRRRRGPRAARAARGARRPGAGARCCAKRHRVLRHGGRIVVIERHAPRASARCCAPRAPGYDAGGGTVAALQHGGVPAGPRARRTRGLPFTEGLRTTSARAADRGRPQAPSASAGSDDHAEPSFGLNPRAGQARLLPLSSSIHVSKACPTSFRSTRSRAPPASRRATWRRCVAAGDSALIPGTRLVVATPRRCRAARVAAPLSLAGRRSRRIAFFAAGREPDALASRPGRWSLAFMSASCAWRWVWVARRRPRPRSKTAGTGAASCSS